MGDGDVPSEVDTISGHVSTTELALAVKALNKPSTFAKACGVIRRAVSTFSDEVETKSADPQSSDLVCSEDALFASVLRAGVVLRTRHLEGSAAWVHGDEVFAEALAKFANRDGTDVEKLEGLKLLTESMTRAASEAPEDESEVNQTTSTPTAFEGQLSGELPREFDRPDRSEPVASAVEAIRRLVENTNSDGASAEELSAQMERHTSLLAEHGIQIQLRNNSEELRNTSERRAVAGTSMHALNERTVTLGVDDIEKLHEKDCPVCRDDFAVGDKLLKMPCSAHHAFHNKCVKEWLKRDDSCPLCRTSLPIWLGRPQYA